MRSTLTVLLLAACTLSAQQPQRIGGKPNLTGVWQYIGEANWDILDHSAAPGAMYETGAIGAKPAGLGIVEGNAIPYKPAALEQKRKNYAERRTADPEAKCYMPGIPRANYMPYPFQIVQSTDKILFAYSFATANRVVNMTNHTEAPVDSWMGWSNGRWEGDTLVIEVTGLNGLTWLDRAGNQLSDRAKVTERFTPQGVNHILYEATIEDTKNLTAPFKIGFPLYRRIEKNAQLLEFKCVEFAEEMMYGHLTKK